MSTKKQKDEKRYQTLARHTFRTEIEKALEANINELDAAEVINLFHYTERELKKRVLASMSFAFGVMKEYDNYNQDEIFVQIIAYCAKPLPAYDYIHQTQSTDQAFALWVLDILNEIDKVEELYDILPQEYAYSGAVVCAVDYSETLIAKLAYVCENKDRETKEIFEKILTLLPTDTLKNAEKYFDDSLHPLIDIYLSVAMENLSQMDKVVEEIDRFKKNVFPLSLNAMGNLQVDKEEIGGLLNRTDTYYEVEALNGLSASDFGAVKPELIQKRFKQFARKEMFDFHIEDPYSICAMYHIHQFRKTDRFWIMGPTLSLLDMAALRLPWNGPLSFCEETNEKKETALDLYRLQYRSEDFGTSTDVNRLMNESQIIYYLTQGVIVPRKFKSFEAFRLILESQGVAKEEINKIINYANAYSMFVDRKDDDLAELEFDKLFDLNDEGADDKQIAQENSEILPSQDEQKVDCLAELVRIKEENERLRGEFHHIEKLLKKEREQFKTQNEQYKREHAELIDLRNIIFKQATGEDNSEENSKLSIEYPYTVKKNVCVFGGHDSWRKVIKPMFTNVRFIHKDVIPNVDLIKNSDIIWIQPNSLAHMYYYTIIDIVRTHNIPVRYFSYASASKCAEQLVLEDLK